jgi:hypothetical protein
MASVAVKAARQMMPVSFRCLIRGYAPLPCLSSCWHPGSSPFVGGLVCEAALLFEADDSARSNSTRIVPRQADASQPLAS